MNQKYPARQMPGITLADVLYAVFRHKWKILFIIVLGFIAASIAPRYLSRTYQSEAKLFVKYVVDNKSPGQVGSGSTVTSDESANAINTEMEILTSLDLAQQVADEMGPDKILAKVDGGTNRYAAAGFIRGSLAPYAAKGSKVIRVTFTHPDPEMVQPILTQIIKAYLSRHEEVHRHVGLFDEFLSQQTDQLKQRLKDTESELRHAKASAGIISLEDSKKVYTEQIAGIEEKIAGAEADLAERKATAEEMARLLHADSAVANNQGSAMMRATSPDKIAEYNATCALLESQRKKLQDLLEQFTPENSWVKDAQARIAAAKKRKEQLEQSDPGLIAIKAAEAVTTGPEATAGLRVTLMTELAKAKALQSKILVFNEQLTKIRKQAGEIDEAEASITELQRTRQLQEKNYEYFKENLEQSKFDQALGAGRTYNISIIQEPSPCSVVSKVRQTKTALMLGSIALAFGLAFLIEFALDNSVKRPGEVTSKLGLELFLSIPRVRLRNGHLGKGKLLATGRQGKLKAGDDTAVTEVKPSRQLSVENGQIAPWDARHILRPFFEALGDRLITFFEINNLTHKPKLVAVTSCSPKAGVSTLATGLAACLSEMAEGNVLMVDMSEKNGAVRQFHKGDPTCGLEEVLETEHRENALIHDKLYVVSEPANGHSLPVPMPKRFRHLIPKLRASDYDFIIFDMPPITQVSITPRLARFMDFVVVIAESEKTNRDVVRQTTSALAKSNVNLGLVLNKARTYLPRWILRER